MIQAKLDHKPGPFAVFGIMAAALAVPFSIFVPWFTGEISELKAEIGETKSAAILASENSLKAKSASDGVVGRIDSLVVSIARGSAKVDAPQKADLLMTVLATDLYQRLQTTGVVAEFRYSNFDGHNWLFIDEGLYNQRVPSSDQSAIAASFNRSSVRLELE